MTDKANDKKKKKSNVEDTAVEVEVKNGGNENTAEVVEETTSDSDEKKSDPPTPEDIIADLRVKLEESEDKHLRLVAEFDNFRKRNARQYEDIIKAANRNIVTRLLEVVDNFERALEAAGNSSDKDSLLKGMELVYKNLYDILEHEGLEPIEAVGKEFDPNFHEAMMQVESDEYLEGTIVQEMTKGYKLAGKVVRHSRVPVSRGPAVDNDKKE